MQCKPRNDAGFYNSRQKPYLQTIWSLDIKGKLSVNMASVRHSGVSAGLTQNTGFLVPTTVGKGKPLKKKKNPLDSGTFKFKNAVQTLDFKIVHLAEIWWRSTCVEQWWASRRTTGGPRRPGRLPARADQGGDDQNCRDISPGHPSPSFSLVWGWISPEVLMEGNTNLKVEFQSTEN